jgi:DNA-binding transcriptional LysR family regulator
VDLELLAVFREVASRGSFSAAASSLGYTQSAVSRQISALETDFGAALFDRLPRGLRALRELAAGRLRVGAFPTANADLVPRAAAAFQTAYPAVELTLREGLSGELAAAVRAGALDLAVVSAERPIDGLDLRHLTDDPMLVAMPRGHPLSQRQHLRLADLADADWIAGRESPAETLMSTAARPDFRPRVRYVIGEWIAKQGLVAAGLGLTLIPSLAARSLRPDVALVPLHEDDIRARRVYLATMAGTTPPPAVTAFAGLLDRTARPEAGESG